MDRRRLIILATALVGALGFGASRRAGAQVGGRPVDEYRLLPVRIHLIRAAKTPSLNARIVAADARRILGKINKVWAQAGIQFYAESVLAEEAEAQELYEGLGENRSLGHLRLVRPKASRTEKTFHLYYIREMGPNGVCLDGSHELLFVKDTAALRPVPGGIDEPLPRVSAHEMGHALGLPHRQDTTNLMASGTTGTSLNDEEIRVAREKAEKLRLAVSPNEALRAAGELKAGEPRADLLTVLAGLPDGEVARAARALQSARP